MLSCNLKPLFLVFILVWSNLVYGQSECKECPSLNDIIEKNSNAQTNVHSDLNAKGIVLENGKIIISPEANRLLTDTLYRKMVYSDYSFDSIPGLLERKEYFRMLWHLVNAYPNNKKLAYDIAVNLAKLGIKGEHYVSTFYTYALFDPETMSMENGKPVLMNPELIEAKMNLFNNFSKIQ